MGALEGAHSEASRCDTHFILTVSSLPVRQRGRIPAPAVHINQSHQIIAAFPLSLHMCRLPSNPQPLPPGMTPKADSVVFSRVNF